MNNYCAICLVCRDENQYLKEWVDYHLLIGFDHIQIWDNESKIPIKDTMKEYIDKGVVSVKEKKGLQYIKRQTQCYNDSVKIYLNNYKWVSILDTDEFIVLLDKDVNIKDYLKQYEKFGGVGLNWLLFGSNGHKTTQKSQLESFTQSAPNHSANKHIKVIVQPERVVRMTGCHRALCAGMVVNVKRGQIGNHPFNEPPILTEVMRINHYVTRSEEDFELKRQRGPGDQDNSNGPSEKYSQKFFESYNSENVQNYDILNLLKRIKDG